MNLQEIIAEADILVPNSVPITQKIMFLNNVESDFYNVVKIPKTVTFDVTAGQSTFSIPADVRSKNVDRVSVGSFWYNNLDYMELGATDAYFDVDDDTNTITLQPEAYYTGKGLIRYRKYGVPNFVSSNLNASPSAPPEYHYTYAVALASYLAHTQDDGIKAANYESQYKSAWNVAAQNYQVGGIE